MNSNTAKNFVLRNLLLCAAAIAITSCGTATFSKTGSDAQIESLRNFELAFIGEFAVPGKGFNATAFDAKVNEGNAKFQHLRSKASRGKVTPALAGEMKKDVNKVYDHALGR